VVVNSNTVTSRDGKSRAGAPLSPLEGGRGVGGVRG
jgi:hypothetical protein